MAIGTSIIRYPNKKRNKANKIKSNKKGTLEKILVGLVFLGMVILPFIYIFTNLFYFANYNLPVLLQIVVSLLIVPMQGTIFQTKVTHTFVNGNLFYENERFHEGVKGVALVKTATKDHKK